MLMPEERLVYKFLQQMVADLGLGSRRYHWVRIKDWLREDWREPYSPRWCCEVLNLEVGRVREYLRCLALESGCERD